jgi:hypothetical protein
MTAERAVDLELVLAADISNSMDLEEVALVRQGFVRAFRHRDVIDAIQRGRFGRIAERGSIGPRSQTPAAPPISPRRSSGPV